MADTTATSSAGARRDFLTLLTGAGLAVATGATLWPVLDALRPDAQEAAEATPLIDISSLAEDSVLRVVWNGQPVLIRRLTAQQAADALTVVPDGLPDPADYANRVKPGYERYVVVIGLNTGTVCELEGSVAGEPRGDFGGWVCPCDGSQYDVLGRVRSGPAPRNLVLPRYTFVTDAQIRLG